MSNNLDDPAVRRRTVRTLLVLTPFMFVLCIALSLVQKATIEHSLLIAVVGVAMCLVAALVIHLAGSKSAWVLVIVRALLGAARR